MCCPLDHLDLLSLFYLVGYDTELWSNVISMLQTKLVPVPSDTLTEVHKKPQEIVSHH